MNSYIRAFKYSCRKCSIRQRCIDDKNFGPGLKIAVVRRFENRTDTFETWDMLQQDCLHVRYELQKKAKRRHVESGLIKRLREAREAGPKAPVHEPQSVPAEPNPGLVTRTPWVPPQPVVPEQAASTVQVLPTTVSPCGFTVVPNQRLVRLPDDGDVVLGRFEHGFSNPPDVDLSFEDGDIPSVSRRHALVTGRGGLHWIEDMGSSNGTYVNGNPVPLGKSVQLGPGDRVLVGRCRLEHAPLPDWILDPDPRVPHIASLLVTHTGHRLEIPNKTEMIVGRPDPNLDYAPDVNLSIAGEISFYVSRRHIRLLTRGGLHFVEEIGSAAGTRVNGRPIRVGDAPEMLHHGDQLWLGGCVLAYEWRLH